MIKKGVSVNLNALDGAFWLMESPKTPVHIAAIVTFRRSMPKNQAEDFYLDLIKDLRSGPLQEPFNLKLANPSSKMMWPKWQRADKVDLDYHVRHLALPSPGTKEQLQTMVARLHSKPLDPAFPLWEFYLIEGLCDDRFALYFKVHHSYLDGVEAMAILEKSYTSDPHDFKVTPPWAAKVKKRRRRKRPLANPIKGAASHIINTVKNIKEIGHYSTETIQGWMKDPSETIMPFTSPHTPLNGLVTAPKGFTMASLSLGDCRRIARYENATINDIILSLCGDTLRQCLQKTGSLPEVSMTSIVPVSLEGKQGVTTRGNKLGFVLCSLGTHIPDPLKRLQFVKNSMSLAKGRLGLLSPKASMIVTVTTDVAFMASNFINTLTGNIPPLANIVISNVVGPSKPLYLKGARMEALFPASILMNGQSMNISVVSCDDYLHFGVVGCQSFQGLEQFPNYLEDSLQNLLKKCQDKELAYA